MDLPVLPPVKPMLAKPVSAIPEAPQGMQYEAKWDGFRCLVFRDGDEIELISRTGKSLVRYFPELVDGLRERMPQRCVLDGEIVLPLGGRLDFEALQQRIHPAASRVRLLAERTPVSFVAFDLLALDDTGFLEAPLTERRRTLERALRGTRPPLYLAPVTYDSAVAQDWFAQYEGAGLDGVVAKRTDLPYRPGERVMLKVKHERTADCVLAGLRPHKSGPEALGSLLLGLYDDSGVLQYVGASSSFPAARRRELMRELAPLGMNRPEEHPWARWQDEAAHGEGRMPGAPSRWSGGKDASWVPLRPERVCEVAYDHMEGKRFRHTVLFRRWRPDREPGSCTYEQLEEPVRFDLEEALGGR
ncbi:ATP-dependent DNA ligase [Streptomyces sp. RK75]|uniref:ATP-dependent DNA ligase n=1 Tax=Streptomyces sp. RK75 TaxID=2824895 RepID=UPI001B3753FF|nr:ATP-dependent DNA ligase [Streptomyces sp. RK75]MBQ0862552.1 ATP-dependent DNA ligase [Streptomyces sp. RK75]